MATNPKIPVFPEDREWLAFLLREHPEADAQVRILAATQDLIRKSDQPEDIIDLTIRNDGAEAPELMAKWLLQIGEADKALDFVSQGAGNTLPVALSSQVKLQALLMQNDFEGVRRLLEEDASQFPELLRETLLALADSFLETSQEADPTDQWLNAYKIALEAKNTGSVLMLADIASREGWFMVAREALEWSLEAGLDPARANLALNQLFAVNNTMRDTGESLRAARRISAANPDDLLAQNNVYYLENLLGDPLNTAPERFVSMVERFPDQIFRSSYAFALWKADELERATEQINALDERFRNVPACRLVMGLVAYDNGDPEQARQLVSGIDSDQLFPEEAQLLTELFSRLEN
jgi:hypothetical protein